MNKWIFIIDTDQYAGNFERDMCAYLTGVLGDCEVGEEFSKMYDKEVNIGRPESVFIDYIEWRSDDHGCYRPCQCWPTKGWLSIGHDKAVRKEEWNQKEADKVWQHDQSEIYRGYLKTAENIKVGDGWTQEAKNREIKRLTNEIEKALKWKCPKYEPYNSVAIFFEKKPTEEMIALMKERAFKFSKAKRDAGNPWEKNFDLAIYGFRLVKETTKMKEEVM